MKQMLSYRTVLLAQTGICSEIPPMALRSTSVIGFINKCIDDVIPTLTMRRYPNQKPWIELPFSRSGTLTRKLVRNPAMPFDDP